MTVVCIVYGKGIFTASEIYFDDQLALASHPALLCGDFVQKYCWKSQLSWLNVSILVNLEACGEKNVEKR